MQGTGRKNRSYQVKKNGIKDEYIDRQVLALHVAITEKMLRQIELVPQVRQTLEKRRELGRIGYGAYITWDSILDIIEHPNDFRAAMLENTPKMRRLRRKTPFVNILTEEERQKALLDNATGILTSLDNLY
ncbi:hypothetical protein FE810_10155 [Thalassotalea litorea]|uniref:Uncharacterized protein n=1 Tax=Thalassotalea litorea TaxID=2020715 RepID=A0A5R9IK21_9GAMM|nr:hypothetical protein [Thalassotalea litorea]TLU64813.1 hypothetical protein FE810_10155 [Thalassotalea litorea]